MTLTSDPDRIVCPQCLRLSGVFLPEVSTVTREDHFRCTNCDYVWIPADTPPSDASETPPAGQ